MHKITEETGKTMVVVKNKSTICSSTPIQPTTTQTPPMVSPWLHSPGLQSRCCWTLSSFHLEKRHSGSECIAWPEKCWSPAMHGCPTPCTHAPKHHCRNTLIQASTYSSVYNTHSIVCHPCPKIQMLFWSAVFLVVAELSDF